MAFPQVSDTDTTSGHVTSNSDPWTLTYPANIASGDLLILFAAIDGGNLVTQPSGWAGHNGQTGNPVSEFWATKDATGSETGTFDLTVGAAEQGSWQIIRIPAASWWGTVSTGVASAGVGGQSTQNPTSAQVSPSWGAADTLWISMCAVDTSRTIDAFPADYGNTYSDPSGGAGGATLAVCRRERNASSETPGDYTISASDDAQTYTIAIRPSAAGNALTRTTGDSVSAISDGLVVLVNGEPPAPPPSPPPSSMSVHGLWGLAQVINTR